MATQLLVGIEALRDLAIQNHYECDDRWYSCPSSPEGSADDSKTGCTCGALKHNVKVQELSVKLARLVEGETEESARNKAIIVKVLKEINDIILDSGEANFMELDSLRKDLQ